MNITIGHTTFDRVAYDADADVLYLHVGDPATAVAFEESPEGHGLRDDAAGHVVGLTLVNVRWGGDRHQPLVVTIPERIAVDPGVLASAITAA